MRAEGVSSPPNDQVDLNNSTATPDRNQTFEPTMSNSFTCSQGGPSAPYIANPRLLHLHYRLPVRLLDLLQVWPKGSLREDSLVLV